MGAGLDAGTKRDLEGERAVAVEEGETLSEAERMLGFLETSSKENHNVDSAFIALAKELKARYSQGQPLDDYYQVPLSPFPSPLPIPPSE